MNRKGDESPGARPAISVPEVLRLLLETDSYPRPGNADWAAAARMEAEALAKAGTAAAIAR